MKSIETSVTEICKEFGRLDSLGVDDNLLDVGCDSLAAAEILARIELLYGVDVTDQYFRLPTVRNLVSAIDSVRSSAGLSRA